jgi:hypothetical protein
VVPKRGVLCLIGIDDTDNLESRGTGFRARDLGSRLGEAGLGVTRGITRHQLLVHPDIPYTSHNSAACLAVDVTAGGDLEPLIEFCRDYLLAESAPGADAGLCVARADAVDETVVRHGQDAKTVVLDQDRARDVARARGLHLEGLTGTRGGIIGALAAVGLRRAGHDGRFIWVRGVRELSGTARVGTLLATTGIDAIETRAGEPVPTDATICVDPWPRPVLRSHRAVLLARPTETNHVGYEWEILTRDEIRAF